MSKNDTKKPERNPAIHNIMANAERMLAGELPKAAHMPVRPILLDLISAAGYRSVREFAVDANKQAPFFAGDAIGSTINKIHAVINRTAKSDKPFDTDKERLEAIAPLLGINNRDIEALLLVSYGDLFPGNPRFHKARPGNPVTISDVNSCSRNQRTTTR